MGQKLNTVASGILLGFVTLLMGCDDEGGVNQPKADADSTSGNSDGSVRDTATIGSLDAAVTLVDGSSTSGADASVDVLPACAVPTDATTSAKLRTTADDYVRIWFNGVLVAEPTSLWPTLKQYDVNVFLHAGRRNVIAIEARNEQEQGGLDRGFIAELEYIVDAKSYFVDTDTTWKVNGTEVTGWTGLDFDDSGWKTPVSLGKSGIAPWGSVVFNTNAEWLWTYYPDKSAAEKADNEKLWFRKVFFMNAAGQATDQPVCR
jgi:hypothetical protein